MSNVEHEPAHRPLPAADIPPLPPSVEKAEQATPAQENRAAIDSLFEQPLTNGEAACFRREKASEFVRLKPEQVRILPPRKK
jgi:hypothetical protein